MKSLHSMTAFSRAILLGLLLASALPARALDLGAALQAALKADPSLAGAIANRDAALENIAIARARLLPQLTLQSTVQQMTQTTERAGQVQDFSGPSQSTQLNLRQAVYRRRDHAGLDIGKLQALYGEHKLVSAQSDLWNRASVAWVDVLLAQAVKAVYEGTLEAVRRAADQEKRRFEGGDGTRDAMAEAAAQLASARAQAAESVYELQTRLQAFNLITGLSVQGLDGFQLPRAAVLAGLPGPQGALLERILEINTEVLAAQVAEQISERRLAQSSADHWPTLDFVAGVNRAQNDTTNTLGIRYNNTQAGVQLVVPIYAGGGISAAQRQAAASLSAAKSERESLIQKLKTQFHADWHSQSALRERADAARESVEASRESRRAAELGAKAGVRTWADIGAAELTGARRAVELLTLTANLLKVQARLLALLPATDPAWDQWIQTLSQQARQ